MNTIYHRSEIKVQKQAGTREIAVSMEAQCYPLSLIGMWSSSIARPWWYRRRWISRAGCGALCCGVPRDS